MIELSAFQNGVALFSVKTEQAITICAESSVKGPSTALYIGRTFVVVPVGAALYLREIDESSPIIPREEMPRERCGA